eukprot:TRINITY_DN77204_c0_g1_i1.p1 TRINITY_DN77204_c0_g1~~TRINITY_DN77204_c0_g1_i1.p1  ORF type:complete len:479 (+),score=64.24 TRINITY_DN77204_c0_g1_i1:66-1502(+)
MFRAYVALSPKLRLDGHPKNILRWKPGRTFYHPKKGASKMKWKFTLPYRREVDSLLHYPEVSSITGKPVDWYHGTPKDGYEGSRVYGDHTLELGNLPLGRTPEYMQERLRRFFSKFGPVVNCRANPHPLDPYQCEGTAYVSFRDRATALAALKAPLKLPPSLHDKVISMRHLDSDKRNDTNYHEKVKFWDAELITIARKLHTQLCDDKEFRENGKPLTIVGLGLMERELMTSPDLSAAEAAVEEADRLPIRGRGGVPPSKGGLIAHASTRLVGAKAAVSQRFGTWQAFLAEPPLDELFMFERRNSGGDDSEGALEGPIVVKARLVSQVHRTRILHRAMMAFKRRSHADFSVWWREGKISLPDYTQRRVTWWDHLPPLPFDVQIMSRSKDRHRIHDERFLYRHALKKNLQKIRNEKRAEWGQARKQQLEQKHKELEERRQRGLNMIGGAKCAGLLGQGLVRVSVGPGGGPSARAAMPTQ